MSAKVIDFFVEAGKRGYPHPPDFTDVEPPPALTPLQRRICILLDLLINEVQSNSADPTCFFVLYGKPWDENKTQMLWHYLNLEFTAGDLRGAMEQIYQDMKRRKK